MSVDEPIWVERARADLLVDTREVPGVGMNPFIAGLYRELGLTPAQDDQYPWCAVYMSALMHRCGIKPPARVRAARSFLAWGEPTEPHVGAVVVLRRGDPTDHVHGHVGLFVKEDATRVWLLGGNQHNCVSIHDFDKTRVIGVRRPPC